MGAPISYDHCCTAPAGINPHLHGNGTASVVYRGMANGQVVLVTTEPLGGGAPVRSVYYVAEQDPAKAAAIIAAMMAPNERVEAWGPLPEPAVKALGLKPGDFTRG
ncbi:hypothetical protein [Bradyrhizobium archetypum]|nr:hypothetical protein [Bradyrhizobium archetypum]